MPSFNAACNRETSVALRDAMACFDDRFLASIRDHHGDDLDSGAAEIPIAAEF
jgi:hypothetical protein